MHFFFQYYKQFVTHNDTRLYAVNNAREKIKIDVVVHELISFIIICIMYKYK